MQQLDEAASKEFKYGQKVVEEEVIEDAVDEG